MPITIVVGGQFGSEGKGKVACFLAEKTKARAVVRVGGPNSGHTVVDSNGRSRIFRQLPTAAVLANTVCVISAGSYIDLDVLRAEMSLTNLRSERIKIDGNAVIITPEHKLLEKETALRDRVGSTLTGTGAAVSQRINRESATRFARHVEELKPFLCDTGQYLYDALKAGDRIIAEGSQGFGLSAIHTPYFPFATSRDTTAAGVLSEIGLGPTEVDEVALVIRAHPIRVPGNSGPLPREVTWESVTEGSGCPERIEEFTSVTRAKRRVAEFDADIVNRAIRANAPSSIFLNHVDYVDTSLRSRVDLSPLAERFIRSVEAQIGMSISYIGSGPKAFISRDSSRKLSEAA